MKFSDIVNQASALLQDAGRVTYRALKREFDLDEDALEDLREELIIARRVAIDEDDKILVWVGSSESAPVAHSSPSPAPAGSNERQSPAADRRQLTVMFCDLIGSTPMSAQLDPEDYRDIMQAYQEMCGQVLARFTGHIARYEGDGILVYFGYPRAQEDAAAQAVRAGLQIIEGLPNLNARFQPRFALLQGRPLQVRIGMHTGLVVVGEMGSPQYRVDIAVGETPNIAARIQGQAGPNEVMISTPMYRLVEGLFECEELGSRELKGIVAPQSVYLVKGEGEAQSRFEVAVRRGLTPLVGREEEVNLLRKRWQQAKGGQGQAVTLSGEPGIGKSRLVQELQEQVVKEGGIRIEYRCSPYHQNSALHPVIEHLQHVLQFEPDDTPAAKLEKLQSTLSAYRFPQADTVPLLAALLSLPHPEGYPPIRVSAQKQKEKTQAALVAWLFEKSEKAPVCCTWEDLHWADPSTLEFSSLCLDQIPTACMFTVLTFRPEFSPPWGMRSYLSQITLNRLGRTQVGEMVEKVTGGKVLPVEVMQQIVSKTDGVPLFVEELTKMVTESGLLREAADHYELSGPLPSLAIPATLQDSLMARLDRLGTVKEIAQLGATLGREFSYELIQAILPVDEETLQQGLNQLVEAELVYQGGLLPQARYIFKHALVQDTAYQSLLKSKRRQVHQQVAQVLEERFAETVETQPELVAHHYAEAGIVERAILYWQKAGERAAQRSANVEAISHFTAGLELLKALPDTLERTQQELPLQIALGLALAATKGFAAPEVEKSFTRVQELYQYEGISTSESSALWIRTIERFVVKGSDVLRSGIRQVGETFRVFPALIGLCTFHMIRGELETARKLGERCLRLAQRVQDPALLMETHGLLGITLFHLGELVSARAYLEQVVALYDPQQHHFIASLYGNDPGVTSLSFAAMAVMLLGYSDQALENSHQALTLAQEVSHPFSLALALVSGAIEHQSLREWRASREWAEAAMTLSTDQGFSLWVAHGTILRGRALIEQGQDQEGITQMHSGMAAYRATGAKLQWPYFLDLLADAYGKVGQIEEGLTVLTEALDIIHKNGGRVREAELHRLKGELLIQLGAKSEKLGVQDEAEECFQKALEVARHQSAKLWELRASTSLARLWQQQGKKEEAHHVLAEVYGWFTEGFDTADLQEAKALLDGLA